MESIPSLSEVDPTNYIFAECNARGFKVRVNKCIVNKSGFTLNNLYINGPTITEDFQTLKTTNDNSCRGGILYDNGPEYVFSIDRNFADCATQVQSNATHVTYHNAIQGLTGKSSSLISRSVSTKYFKTIP